MTHYGRLKRNPLRVDVSLPDDASDPEQAWTVDYQMQAGKNSDGSYRYFSLMQPRKVPLEIPPYEMGVQKDDLDNVEKEIKDTLKNMGIE